MDITRRDAERLAARFEASQPWQTRRRRKPVKAARAARNHRLTEPPPPCPLPLELDDEELLDELELLEELDEEELLEPDDDELELPPVTVKTAASLVDDTGALFVIKPAL